MTLSLRSAAAALCALTAVLPFAEARLAPPLTTAPVPGPGAVLEAARGIMRAIEQRDRDQLQRAFEPMHDEEGFACTFDKDGGVEAMDRATSQLAFQDVDRDGKPIVARDVATAVSLLLGIGGDDVRVEHRLLGARANCPSGDCSWAVVDFERTTRRGDAVVVTPMRATLLAKYRDEAPHMRVFVWHAVPAPAPTR